MSAETASDRKVSEWDAVSYFPLALCPAGEYRAVYAMENDDGTCSLHAYPIEFVATARVVRKTYRGVRGRPNPQLVRTEEDTDIVGVDLSEGGFHICEDSRNFCGYIRLGDDIRDATWMMHMEYRERLRPEFRRSDDGE